MLVGKTLISGKLLEVHFVSKTSCPMVHVKYKLKVWMTLKSISILMKALELYFNVILIF